MSSEPRLPSSVEFGSFLVYNPRPTTDVGRQSKRVCEAVKTRTASWARIQRLGERLRDELGDDLREKFLSANTTLVPVPGHSKMRDPESHWPAREICRALVENGVGGAWLPLLERVTTVPKSAWSTREERERLTPTVHFDSMAVRGDVGVGERITVVDDVVTSGKTMLAAVGRLLDVYPEVTVRAFALIRTMSDEPVRTIRDPCEGIIRLETWGASRRP